MAKHSISLVLLYVPLLLVSGLGQNSTEQHASSDDMDFLQSKVQTTMETELATSDGTDDQSGIEDVYETSAELDRQAILHPQGGYIHMSQHCVIRSNIALYKGKTVQECAAICDGLTRCAGFEFGVYHGGSSTFYSPGDCQPNYASDSRGCDGARFNLDFYVKRNGITHLPKKCVAGHNMQTIKGKTVQQCAAICASMPRCAAFEYGVAYGGPNPTVKPGDCKPQSSNDPRGCSGSYHNQDLYVLQSGYTHLPATCVIDNNIAKYAGKTVRECATLCDASPLCVAYEFGIDRGGYGSKAHFDLNDCWLQGSTDYRYCDGKHWNCDLYIKQVECKTSADCPSSKPICMDGGTCKAMSCANSGFTMDGLWENFWNDVTPMKGRYTMMYFKYIASSGCLCLFNDWISSSDQICSSNYNYFRFTLKGGTYWSRKTEMWEFFLYGDNTMQIRRDGVVLMARGAPDSLGKAGFCSTPNKAAQHTTYEMCLPSQKGLTMTMNIADPVQGGSYSGTCVSTPPKPEDPITITIPVVLPPMGLPTPKLGCPTGYEQMGSAGDAFPGWGVAGEGNRGATSLAGCIAKWENDATVASVGYNPSNGADYRCAAHIWSKATPAHLWAGSWDDAITCKKKGCATSADCPTETPICMNKACKAMSCANIPFTMDGLWESYWADVTPMKGRYTMMYFKYIAASGCLCLFNDWIKSENQICADNYNYFKFTLKGGSYWNRKTEVWEFFLYGDNTMQIKRDKFVLLARGVPDTLGKAGFGSSPNVARKHTSYEMCLPSQKGMTMTMNIADPVKGGSYTGQCVSTPPKPEDPVIIVIPPVLPPDGLPTPTFGCPPGYEKLGKSGDSVPSWGKAKAGNRKADSLDECASRWAGDAEVGSIQYHPLDNECAANTWEESTECKQTTKWDGAITCKKLVCATAADCPADIPMCIKGVCKAMSCAGSGFTMDGLWEPFWAGVTPMKGRYTVMYFKYIASSGCLCLFNDWIKSSDRICADNYNYFKFTLKGGNFWKRTTEVWEFFLYGDNTMKIKRDGVVIVEGVVPDGMGSAGFGSSPNLATDHTTYEMCLPSQKGMTMTMNLADPVKGGSYSGKCVDTPPKSEPPVVITIPIADGPVVVKPVITKKNAKCPFNSFLYNPAETLRTYSSVYKDETPGMGHARSGLNSPQAWSSKSKTLPQWMIMDMGREVEVTSLVTQSRALPMNWEYVLDFKVEVSSDMSSWSKIPGSFKAGHNSVHKRALLPPAVEARYYKILPQTFNGWISMRAGAMVCEDDFALMERIRAFPHQSTPVTADCSTIFFNPPENHRSYSSVYYERRQNIGNLDKSSLYSKYAWAPAKAEAGEYMIMDIGEVSWVTGVIQQKRHDWYWEFVTKFSVETSIDGLTYQKPFPGRFFEGMSKKIAKEGELSMTFPATVKARYVKVIVQTWHLYPSMRAGVMLCEAPR